MSRLTSLLLLLVLVPALAACNLPLSGLLDPSVPAASPTPTFPLPANSTQADGLSAPGQSASAPGAGVTPTPGDLPVPQAEVAYLVQPGTPLAMAQFLEPEAGCNWAGVGGQVFDSAGAPVFGLVIQVDGELDGRPVTAFGMSGIATEVGAGGFEVVLAHEAVQTGGQLSARVVNAAGQPLSESASFTLDPSCEGNLVLVNFVAPGAPVPESPPDYDLYFPLIFQAGEGQ